MLKLFQTIRFPFIANLSIGLSVVVTALCLAHFLRLAACPLCILQRMLYLLLTLSALLGVLGYRFFSLRILSGVLMLLSSTTGIFVAGYQTYIQRVAQNVQCSGEAAWWELFVDWAGERWPLMFQANGLCSDPAWKIFGLSLAECSLILFSVLLAMSLLSLWRSLHKISV